MCEKRGMCTRKPQVPLLVVTTLLVGVRPELVGEYWHLFTILFKPIAVCLTDVDRCQQRVTSRGVDQDLPINFWQDFAFKSPLSIGFNVEKTNEFFFIPWRIIS